MISSIKSRWLFLPILLFSIQLCFAEAPSGQANFFFDSSVLPLWDFSGTFQPTNQTIRGAGGQDVPFASAVDLAHDSRGRLTGSGTTTLSIGTDFVAADYRASGRVSGGGAATRVSLVTRFKGTGVFSGLATTFNISVNYKLTVNTANGTLVGPARGEAKISKFDGGKINSDVVAPIPGGTNASWTLQLNITPLRKLGGTGAIFLSNTRALQGNLAGSFSSRANEAKLKFTGINDSKGSTLNLTLASNAGTNQLLSLRGKVLGQTLRQ